jgi:hypothetical protein
VTKRQGKEGRKKFRWSRTVEVELKLFRIRVSIYLPLIAICAMDEFLRAAQVFQRFYSWKKVGAFIEIALLNYL